MIKIYFNDRVIYLTDEHRPEYSQYSKRNELSELIKKFTESEHSQLYIYSESLNELYQNFKSCFKYIEAAGGLVKNHMDKILVINRFDKWDLPKGKVEQGETYQEAAVREVTEECGISKPFIIKQMPSTFHTYETDGKQYLKRTYWFEMIYKGNEELVPKKEEGITEARWINRYEVDKILKKTYSSLIDIWSFV
jgi:ADP-ribose pyrophosphatase YjhB (NUDIX family)